ncbi:MAG: aminotransferase class V-fold PLP-dependent enzyme, partial [Gammaproteobacteria bacterium]|nr:aminotransferase class V-fold PLP-dependent enzyme [Gammaproteobacteria bacterium]
MSEPQDAIDTDSDRRAATARSAFPVLDAAAYLNTASYGPVSAIYAKTLAERTRDDVMTGRAVARRLALRDEHKETIRRELATLVGADAATLRLTQSTTDGLTRIIDRWPWQAGDEVVCTDLEHEACRIPLEAAARRHGLALKVAAVPTEADRNDDWLVQHLSPKTRLIA